MTLQELEKRRDDLYVRIADASGEERDCLLDDVWAVEDEIESLINPPKPKMSKDEFESFYNVQREYERFHDEWGDAAAFYSDYLDHHYQDYLEGWCVFD